MVNTGVHVRVKDNVKSKYKGMTGEIVGHISVTKVHVKMDEDDKTLAFKLDELIQIR